MTYPRPTNSELAQFIQAQAMVDTHEHLRSEKEFVQQGPDLLQRLFGSYLPADLIVAGASQGQVDTLLDGANPDIGGRYQAIAPYWQAVRHTGYGEAVQRLAHTLYGMNEIAAESLRAAAPRHADLCRPGERLRLLRDVANLDHVQIDDFERPCLLDPAGPDFFFYDISWVKFARGEPDIPELAAETGIEVRDLNSLQAVMESVFTQHAALAIAVKSQHAYNRTLSWEPRSEQAAAAALDTYLRRPEAYSDTDRLCLGDWCLAKGIELAIEHDLPFKIHTGYYAGHSRMPVDFIRSGNLCALLARYLDARIVLMHIAYPYSHELIALAKHYPNVYVDLCWAWSIDPLSTADFVRRFIHAVPSNKLFVFGGDTAWPTNSVAYAQQTRAWLTYALESEVREGWLTEPEALELAGRFMVHNQYACFRIEAKKAHARQQAAHLAQRTE
jgi:uncharacterized protein